MIAPGLTLPISWNNAAYIMVGGRLVTMVEAERLNLNNLLSGLNLATTWLREGSIYERRLPLDRYEGVSE